MPRPAIICPRCGRGRVGHDGYTCSCGQRFRVPRDGKVRFLPEADEDALFWVPGGLGFLDVRQVLALPELAGIDPEATIVELRAERLTAAAQLVSEERAEQRSGGPGRGGLIGAIRTSPRNVAVPSTRIARSPAARTSAAER